MKCQDLLSLEDKFETFRMSAAAVVIGALMVKCHSRSGGFWGQQPILDLASHFSTTRRLKEVRIKQPQCVNQRPRSACASKSSNQGPLWSLIHYAVVCDCVNRQRRLWSVWALWNLIWGWSVRICNKVSFFMLRHNVLLKVWVYLYPCPERVQMYWFIDHKRKRIK